ncbi:MAG TPA: nuclear transport factor 2 family protein [Cyclobacteriaceae bacterium]
MKTITVILLAMTTLSISGQSQSKTNPQLEEARIAIAKSNAIYHQSLVKNDPSIFVNCYSDDACIMAPNIAITCGKEALTKFFNEGYAMGLRSGKFVTTDIYGEGSEYVTEEGVGYVYDSAGKQLDEVKYLVLWKKTSKGWKMFRDSFSSNKQNQKP